MDEFFPENNYNPEDEYAPIDAQTSPEPHNDADEIPVIEPPVQHTLPYQQPLQSPYQPQYQQPVQPQYQQPYQPQPQQPIQPQYQQAYTQPEYNGYPQAQPYAQPTQPQQPVPNSYPAAPYQPAQPYAPRQYDQPQQFRQPVQQPQQPVQQQPQPYNKPADSDPYTQNPYVQNPYTQNGYSQPAQPYAQNMPNRPQKPATSTGTKVFIIILCTILAAMLIGFSVYIASLSGNNDSKHDSNNNSFIKDDEGKEDEDDDDFGFAPFGGGNSIGSYTDVEDEITLKADNGDTQKRDDDNPESVGEPDEKAENITLNPLPKDKDDDKYTKQSAYESVSDSVVTVVCYKDKITDNESDIASQGTGTVITADGYIVTNAHVISDSKMYAVNIVLNSGEKYQAKIIGYDTWTDLAVLKIDAKDLKPVTFGDSELVNVGDDVIAIGSPGGVKFQNSLTQGIVSAVDRELSINRYVRYIQSDAAISPGNSGGPLCNIYGQVIGITTAKTVADYFENMTFSIPSATVEEIVSDLMHYGYVKGRARIGFSGTEVSEEDIYYYNTPAGVVISSIDESGSLAGTKLKEGDIITELDGEEITSFQDIYDVLADHKDGDKISVKAVRPGK